MVERLMTPEDVAAALQLHHLTVLKFIKTGKLKASKLGRVYRINPADLDLFLESRSTL